MQASKPVHTIVLDTGAIIKNEPATSTLRNQSESLVTVPSVVSEIRDSATRSRVETTLLPFLELRSPSPASVKFVTDFARRTGDLAVLSVPDLQIIALAHEIECERNGGDWRLRRIPGQKGLNGAPPPKVETPDQDVVEPSKEPTALESNEKAANNAEGSEMKERISDSQGVQASSSSATSSSTNSHLDGKSAADEAVSAKLAQMDVAHDQAPYLDEGMQKVDSAQASPEKQEDIESDSDSEGWITPSNLRKKQAQDSTSSTSQTPEPATMQVAVLTTDHAMQNVILQMNLNLLSAHLTRVKQLKTFVLRCHACFQVTKEVSKQFCPRCGQPSLTRVSCSTNANGEFKLHLKKNMQWNHRGDRYSIPKPVHGSANGRVKGGGKGGWGNELMLTEDQKEYQRAANDEKKQKQKNLMDEDFLPSILTGDRGRAGGRVKVGAGRNVNSRKR